MASISSYKAKNGRKTYRVRYRLGGRGSPNTSKSFTSLTKAKVFKKNVETLGATDAEKILHMDTLDRDSVWVLHDWLEHHISQLTDVGEGTKQDYRSFTRELTEYGLGHRPLEVLREKDIRAWVEHLQAPKTEGGRGLAEKTIKNKQGFLSSALERAVKDEVIPANPAKGVRPRAGATREMETLTPDEFQKVLSHLDAHWHPLAMLFFGTGVRYGEAVVLRKRDFDFSGTPAMVSITRGWKHRGGLGAPKTRRGRRTISLPREVADVLREVCEDMPADDPVFTTFAGAPLAGNNAFYDAWVAAVKASKIGKNVRVHDLRHSHASWMLKHGGLNLQELQYRLGHESITTTVDRYGHLMPEAQVQAAKAAQLAFQPADDQAVDLAAQNAQLQAQLDLMVKLLQGQGTAQISD